MVELFEIKCHIWVNHIELELEYLFQLLQSAVCPDITDLNRNIYLFYVFLNQLYIGENEVKYTKRFRNNWLLLCSW